MEGLAMLVSDRLLVSHLVSGVIFKISAWRRCEVLILMFQRVYNRCECEMRCRKPSPPAENQLRSLLIYWD